MSDKKSENKSSFVSHLSELRSRLIKSFIFLFLTFIVCYFFSENLYKFLVQPYTDVIRKKILIGD